MLMHIPVYLFVIIIIIISTHITWKSRAPIDIFTMRTHISIIAIRHEHGFVILREL